MAAETQYTCKTVVGQVIDANSALDGTSAITILTAGANSVLIRTVRIKAIVSTTRGMVRLFIYEGTNTKIIAEVEIPAVTKSSTDTSFEMVIPLDYKLEPSGILKATTQNTETFNIIVEAHDWAYYTTSVRPESTNYTANTGIQNISTANSSLTGSGTLSSAIITGASNGTLISSVNIKATVNTTMGMIRLFLDDAHTNIRLLTEIPVPAVTKSGTAHSFSARIDFDGKGFALPAAWSLKASTENGEAFNVFAEGLDWAYPA